MAEYGGRTGGGAGPESGRGLDRGLDRGLEKAKGLLESGNTGNIQEVAASVGYDDAYHFSKLFKKKTGQNFIEYLTEIRIGKAKELLRNTDMSMKEVSMQVGYGDPN